MKKILFSFFILFFSIIAVNAQEITINGNTYNEDEFSGESYHYENNILTLNNYEGGEILATDSLNVEILGNVHIATSTNKNAFEVPILNIYGDGTLTIETDIEDQFAHGVFTIAELQEAGFTFTPPFGSKQGAKFICSIGAYLNIKTFFI